MPYLKLIVTPGDRTLELRDAVVKLGRDPLSTIPFTGDDARVVSARHAELRWREGQWHVVDLGSRNGTYLNGRRLSGHAPLKPGDAVTLGETGPKVAIVAVAEGLAETLLEHPKMADARPPAPGRLPEQRVYGITMLAAATGKRFEARGTRIRMGRGSEARAIDSQMDEIGRLHYYSKIDRALISLALGDLAAAQHWIAVAKEEHNPWLLVLPCDPLWEDNIGATH